MLEKMLWQSAQRHADATAVICGNDSVTYAQLLNKVVGLKQGLISLGVRPSAHILLLLPNSIEFVVSYFAIASLKAIISTMNPRSTQYELQQSIKDNQPYVIITDAKRAPMCQTLIKQAKTQIHLLVVNPDGVGISFETLIQPIKGHIEEPQPYKGDIVYLYSSGSTGTPKRICRTQANQFAEAGNIVQTANITVKDVIFCAIPLFHSFGQFCCMLVAIRAGATLLILPQTGQENTPTDVLFAKRVPEVLHLIESYQVTIFPAVPYIYKALAQTPADIQPDLSVIRFCFSSGNFLPKSTYTDFFNRFGIRIRQTYGSAEAGSVSWNTETEFDAGYDSVGTPLKNVDVKIIGEDKTLASVGQAGEIIIKSQAVMRGYDNKPELNQKVLQNGYYYTGDIGYLDENNHLHVTGRKHLLIDVGGHKVNPVEVEQVLLLHPSVQEAVVLGVALPTTGQIMQAFLVTNEPYESEEGILQFCRDRLTTFKVPQVVEFLDEIPRSPLGKVLTGELIQLNSPQLQKFINKQEEQLSREVLQNQSRPEIEKRLQTYMIEELANILQKQPEQIETDIQLYLMGFDSLAAVRFKASLENKLRVPVSLVELLQGGSINSWVQKLSGQILESSTNVQPQLLPTLPIGQHPVSYGQRSMWHLYQLAPTRSAYNRSFVARMASDTDISILRQSFQDLIYRHPSLRTVYTMEDDLPVQTVHAQMPASWQEIDASGWSYETLVQQVEVEAKRPFHLETESSWRMSVFTGHDEGSVLVLTSHHISSDFWSLVLLLNEIGTLYNAKKSDEQVYLPDIEFSYIDFAYWENEMLNSSVGFATQTYWQQKLSDKLPILDLPIDNPRPPVKTYNGASHTAHLAANLVKHLQQFAQEKEVTLYTLLLSIFLTLLYRYSGQEDIIVGSAATSRNQQEFQDVVGYFVNILALRTQPQASLPFETFLQHVHTVVLEALENQMMPFPLLVERLQPERDASRSPIFDVLFVLDKSQHSDMQQIARFAAGHDNEQLNLGGLHLEAFTSLSQDAMYDLTLLIYETEESLSFSWEYNTDLFEPETISRLSDHLFTLLAEVVSNPAKKLGEFVFLTPSEHQQLIHEWNDTQVELPAKSLHELFEVHAQEIPDTLAAISGNGDTLTYAELEMQANQLAHYLYAQGMRPGDLVGVCMERSLTIVVSLLAILKVGGAYLPLDPTYPPNRLKFMMTDARAKLLLAQESTIEYLPKNDTPIICVDQIWDLIVKQPNTSLSYTSIPEQAVYVIYTSGSTGKPKGIMLDHRGRVNNFTYINRRFNIGREDRLLAISSLSFDLSAYDILGSLAAGATIILPTVNQERNPLVWAELVKKYKVTIWNSVPALLEIFINTVANQPDLWPHSLRLARLGGDWMPVTLPARLRALVPHVKIINLGGATEISVDSTIYNVETVQPSWNSIPYGRPQSNQLAYVLDAHLQLAPIGVPGELYFGGIGLAWGYINRPGLTAVKFVPNPFSPYEGDRLYRTGDLAKYLPDGNLELLGRIDRQVKIRGVRIELGEIQSALRLQPEVQNALVTVHQNQHEEDFLVAYITVSEEITSSMLQQKLKDTLPSSMIPPVIIFLEAFPLTPNGKINYQALPTPNLLTQPQTEFVAPRTPFEEELAQIWTDVLGIEKISIHDNFFELGGHSLLAMQLATRIYLVFQLELPLITFFEFPTIADQALACLQYLLSEEEELAQIAQDYPLD